MSALPASLPGQLLPSVYVVDAPKAGDSDAGDLADNVRYKFVSKEMGANPLNAAINRGSPRRWS